MNGNPDVIEILNEVLTAELTAINQYFIDAKMLQNWGYDGLGGKFRHESIDEMQRHRNTGAQPSRRDDPGCVDPADTSPGSD